MNGRTTWYEAIEEMQQDLEAYLEGYTRKHPHRGRGTNGRTPHQAFKAGIKDAKKAAKVPRRALSRLRRS